MTLGERLARDKGVYPEAKSGRDIPFRIFFSNHWLAGYLIPNSLRLMIGVPGTFLVFWDERFQETICWSSKSWVMYGVGPDLVETLGEWIEAYYE
jgi:hypothetical protein